MLFIFSFIVLPKSNSQVTPWCFEATEADYQASLDFANNVDPSSQLSGEMNIPLQIIYVNFDDGTPPNTSGNRWSEIIPNTNSYFEGSFNFYICGFHHINSTLLTDFDFQTEKQLLYNTYHVEDAINVYIVRFTDRTRAQFPWDTPHNAIWVPQAIDGKTLAHELGHYFGLFHTFSNYYINSQFDSCYLRPPSADIDQVPDTNYDPGPTSICPTVCPSIPTCTLTCDQPGGTVTYTYTDIPTDNIMSYHACPEQSFTSGQIDRMQTYLQSHVNRIFLLTPPGACNNSIAEDGYMFRYCNPAPVLVDVAPLKDIRVETVNHITGYSRILKSKDDGRYLVFSNCYSNPSEVTLSPQKSHPLILTDPQSVPANYQPMNGLTTFDLVRISKHILGIEPLFGPYSKIAADANNSGSITTFDVVTLRKVILGINLDMPSGTWRYIPELYFANNDFEAAFDSNPFQATYNGLNYASYMDNITLNMNDDIVSDPNSWSFRSVKVGDVNCDMVLDEFSPNTNGLVNFSASSPGCFTEGDVISATVFGTSNLPIVGFQFGFNFNSDNLQYLGTSAGDLPDFSADNFFATNDEIRLVWQKNNLQGENLQTPKPLFNLYFKAKNNFCNIQNELILEDTVLPNLAIGTDLAPVATSLSLSCQVKSPIGNLISISPNPSASSFNFDIQLSSTATVEIQISDYLGNIVQNTQQFTSGNHSIGFSNLSSLTSGVLNYSVRIADIAYSGVLIKTQP